MIKKIICILVIILSGSLIYLGITKQLEIDNQKKIEAEQNELKEEIKSHYNTYVKTKNDATLYISEETKDYIEYGKVSKDVELTLDEINIDHNTKYFYIKNLNLYISYKDVTPIEKLETITNDRYKSYVVFNQNAVTKDITNLYDSNDNLIYTFNKSMSFPIIIKDTDKYYIEFDNSLYYVKSSETSIIDSNNTKAKTRSNIRTLTYHTIYDTKTQKCTNTVICHPISQFDSHMKYLSENNYLTLTMEELEMFLDGKIRIPTKSIVVTLDDGKYYTNAVSIVEKYKVYATYFIITSVYDLKDAKSDYMAFESHTHDMHNNYVCPGGNQGGQFLCEDEDKALIDIKKSQELLGGSNYLSYPYFDFNDRTIRVLKKAGMHLAFIGQYNSDGYATTKTNKFMVPRKTVFSDTTMDEFTSYYLK